MLLLGALKNARQGGAKVALDNFPVDPKLLSQLQTHMPMVLEQMKQQGKQAELQARLRETTMKMLKDIELNTAKIHKLEAEAIKAIAEAGGVQTGHEIAMINTQIAAEKNRREDLMQAVSLMKDLMPQGEGEAPQQS